MSASLLDLAVTNFLSPLILFFILGVLAGWVRSDLEIPEILAKALALYLIAAIGLKGGVSLSSEPVGWHVIGLFVAVAVVCFVIPFIGYALLRLTSNLDRLNSAVLAAHYGSVSLVTYLACSSFLQSAGLDVPGYMVALLAIMETPAILSGLILARQSTQGADSAPPMKLFREVFLNGTVVLLLGAMLIGYVSGPEGMADVSAFFVSPFKGVLCFFLLDMGLIVGRRMMVLRGLDKRIILFGLYMPFLCAGLGYVLAQVFGLDVVETTLLMTLFASASYIAVPAAMKLAVPKADAAIYVPLPLGVTFPLNIIIGIPLYYMFAHW